ncbi:MAG: peptide chain release factor 1 [Aestuariivita sp.]|nr:peptide chain release factor 1 [Aestuariivita sp.]MCY4201133.1 peptide chain release factor 1 [Aestuariivita sp.]MCY4287798.1 peptide chain release factor 1 [Aestuariivita sp.]MCY4345964.1 peptide chain release factor 1 [Aestuariivita sp.]
MLPEQQLGQIVDRFQFIEAQLATDTDKNDLAKLTQEYSELQPLVDQIAQRRRLMGDITDATEMLKDPEMKQLAAEELTTLKADLESIEHAIRIALIPKDTADTASSSILEIRPGTGGDEAALFAGDLMRMYLHYVDAQGWRSEVLEEQMTELGGVKEIVLRISGRGVFSRLKFESGVHRVQRVPETESSGRIHTSTATIAVLPETKDLDIKIDPKDIRIDTMRASGAGGQHVNKTDSAVRITHLPTGLIATSSQKSQHRNRQIAMDVLKTRLLDQARHTEESKRSSTRSAQVGSGDRSERIRTYNFPQGRLTDHRIKLTLYSLEQVMRGQLDEIIDALTADAEAKALAAAGL